jgi:methionyl-tRNA formyltransferase
MPQKKPSLLFLGKADDRHCARALEFCLENFAPLLHCLGRWGDLLPAEARAWQGDYLVSYLSRWVVPDDLLKRASKGAINFHPAPPEYPGIGCNNFALYENATEYGVTCHHMIAKVDSGPIIAVRRFPVYPEDNVAALLMRTYAAQIDLFLEIGQLMAEARPLPLSNETWTRPPFTRQQFNELFRITPEMSRDEIARRVRAVSYEHYQPSMEIEGFRFKYRPGR